MSDTRLSPWMALPRQDPWTYQSADQLLPWVMPGLNPPRVEGEESVAQAGVSQRRPALLGGERATPERNAELNLSFLDALKPGPEDAALAIAFGPGAAVARRVGAGAIAGLGGLIGDAEGSLLDRAQLLRLRFSPFGGVGMRGERALNDAEAIVNTRPEFNNFRNPDLDPLETNAAFQDLIPSLYRDTGGAVAIPRPGQTPQFLYMAEPDRFIGVNSQLPANQWHQAFDGVNNPNALIQDPMLAIAEPNITRPRGAFGDLAKHGYDGYVQGDGPNMSNYRMGIDQGLLNDAARLRSVVMHEGQHFLQDARRPPHLRPTPRSDGAAAAQRNPALFQEYFDDIAGQGANDPTGDAQHWMYMLNPVEWEARLVERARAAAMQQRPLNFNDGDPWPDLRIR